MMQGTGTEPILMNAGLAVLALLGIATFKLAWSLRDEVRDLTRTLVDPRTGLLPAFDKLAALVAKHDDALDTLLRWKDEREADA